ncbi:MULTISPECIES: hypothetical protein [unclassified Pseudomonas]|uniref:hypothetical protein n=1 Tax=Pseudomonas TaxID=286 RepID=UPI000DA04D7D|nr:MULTISPECIES: hypothetical protein [unclassified Pseudomonas]PYG82014.1 hypothetical protein N428_00963 [Pseudomonas sp. RV120224-01c]PYG85372.1 hypothetical protein N436_00962 [Pseudomonas sp. RV120224-01b]
MDNRKKRNKRSPIFTLEWSKPGETTRTETGTAEVKRDEQATRIIGTIIPALHFLVLNVPLDLGETGKYPIITVDELQAGKSGVAIGSVLEALWLTDYHGFVSLTKQGKFIVEFNAESVGSNYKIHKGYFELDLES